MILTLLDFETAYGKHPATGESITLSKLTTEEYIRHPLFKIHGLGVKIGAGPTVYLHKRADILNFIKTHPWHDSWVVCHHTHFDGAILAWRAGIRPKFWGCTLSMARALYPHESASLGNMAKHLGLPAKGFELESVKDLWELTEAQQRSLGAYCINDVDILAGAFAKMLPLVPASELRLIDTTIRMFTEPELLLDAPLLVEEIEAEKLRKAELLEKIAHDKDTLMSNDKFAELLMSLGIDPPKKLSPSKVKDGRVNPDLVGDPPAGILPSFRANRLHTPEQKIAFKQEKDLYPWTYAMGKSDEEFKLLLDHFDPAVQAVVEARMGVKSTINETRAGRMLGISGRGAWPVYLTYCAATTFRYGGGDKVNPQNFTRGSRLRTAIMAPPGKDLVISDLSQIEARVLAVLAGETRLVEQFAQGKDVYCEMAAQIFGAPVTKRDKEKRFLGKAVVLGAGYGLGWSKFSQMVRIGMLGNEGVLFDQEVANALCISLDSFTSRHYAKALDSKPSNLTEDEHLIHCACAKEIIDRYRSTNQAIVRLWRACHGIIPALAADEDWNYTVGIEPSLKVVPGGIVMPNGLTMQYNGLKQHDGGEWSLTKRKGRRIERSKLYGGLICENLTQSLARIVITDAMNKITRAGLKLALQVHDEVVACSDESRSEADFALMQKLMAQAPAWAPSLPLASEGGTDKRYVK